MLRRINGLCIPVCDICGTMLKGSNDEHTKEMADNGWLNGRIGTKWINWCDSCVKQALQYLQEDSFEVKQ